MASLLSCSACVVSSKSSFPIPGWGSKLRRRWGSIDLAIAPQTERRRSRVLAVVSRVVFRDLDADDFRHPLDKQVGSFLISQAKLARSWLQSMISFSRLLVKFWSISFCFEPGEVSNFCFPLVGSIFNWLFYIAKISFCSMSNFVAYVCVQNTLLLRTIPGLNELGKALLGIDTHHLEVWTDEERSILIHKHC